MINKTNFLRDLYHPKTDKLSLLYKYKRGLSFDSSYATLIEAAKHPFVKRQLYTAPFPKTYEELRMDRMFPSAGNITSEIAWNLIPIVKESQKINSFLKSKKSFENSYLLGDYESAKRILNEIQNQFGKSVWLIENMLLIEESIGGTKANWEALSELAKKLNDGLLLYIIENLSKKIENKLSYMRFKDVLLNQVRDLEIAEEYKEYLLFRINYIGVKKFYNFDFILSVESTSSLVDRYLLMRDILVEISNNETSFNFSQFLKKAKTLEDDLLTQLSNFHRFQEFEVFENTKSCLDLFDLYTQGSYEKCILMLASEIRKNPTIIELYDLYVKSNVELGIGFVRTEVSAQVDKILENLFILYTKSNDTNNAIEELFKIITINFSADWAKQLYGLVQSNINFSDNLSCDFYYSFFSKINNPKSLFDHGKKNSNLPVLLDIYPNLISLSVLDSIASGKNMQDGKFNFLPDSKRKLYMLRSMFRNFESNSVIKLGEEMLAGEISQYIKEEVLLLIFNSYLRQKNISKALLLYIDTYFFNSSLIKRFNNDILLKEIHDNTDAVSSLIEYPIFCSIVMDDPYEVYVSYDNFLTTLKLERPSQLINSDFPQNKLILFFRDVCKFDIIKHSYNFASKEEIESERSLLLDELLKIDNKNESLYIKEITTITQAAAIKSAIREVNKARITINVEQLKDAEISNIKEGFSRFVELANFSKNRNLQGIDITGRQLSDYLKNQNNEVKNKIVYTNDPAFISFKVMFLDMRDKFIFSKEYGLDGYLSTRIRHGTFQNYIRSVFESEMLISQKNSVGDYLDIDFWKVKIHSSLSGKIDEIQQSIHRFSKNIDDYTEFIIKEVIQIRTEKRDDKPNALFDYSARQTELALLFQVMRDTIQDHKAFIDTIFQFLIEKTELILENVKRFFLSNITEKYSQIVSSFQEEIMNIIGKNPYPDLTSAIMRCTTKMRRELANITEWFNISNPTSDMFLDIDTIIQTSIHITNRIYPYKKISPDVTNNLPADFKLKGSINLIYIFRILLDNIIQHSEMDTNELKVFIDVELATDKYVKLVFRNNFSDQIDKNDLIQKLNLVKEKWQKDEQNYEKTDTEGGSGFDKIRRIMTFDMRSKEHKFDYQINDQILSIEIYLKTRLNDE